MLDRIDIATKDRVRTVRPEDHSLRMEDFRAVISDRLHLYPKFSPAAEALARLLEAGLRNKEDINHGMGALGFSVPNLDLLEQCLHASEPYIVPSAVDGGKASTVHSI